MGEPEGFSAHNFYLLRHELLLIQAEDVQWEDVVDGLTLRLQDIPSNYENYLNWTSEAVEATIWLKSNQDGDFVIICRDNGEMDVRKWSDNHAENAKKIWATLIGWS